MAVASRQSNLLVSRSETEGINHGKTNSSSAASILTLYSNPLPLAIDPKLITMWSSSAATLNGP
jgi:hypothetical protein